MKISNIDGELLVSLNSTGMTYDELGKRFGITRNSVAGRIRDHKAKDKRYRLFDTVALGTPITLQGDSLIVGDVHVPTTDYAFAGLVTRVAAKHNVKRLIVAGDMFNMDSFSTYDAVVDQPSWHQERDAARQLFHDWLDWFDEIVIIMGNHDRRLQKWAGGQLDETDIFGMVATSPKIRTSNYGYLTVKTSQGDYMVTHSKNYSINQLTVANELAQKYQCHMITHHEHHTALGWDRFGRYVLVNNGGLFDQSQMAYVVLDSGKNPVMKNSFCMLKNGVPRLFGKSPFTDWSEYF